MHKKILLAIVASSFLTALALSIVSGSPNSQQSGSDDSIEALIAVIRDAHARGEFTDTLTATLSNFLIENMIVPKTGETPSQVKERLASQPTPTPALPPAAPSGPDRSALDELYGLADGASWKNWKNWLSDLPLSQWYGVTTDSDGRVTRLWLDDNNLRGQIPPELGAMANLEALSLSQNQLIGEIPPELASLTKLKTLWLSGNQLTGCVPDSLLKVESNDLSQLGLPKCGAYTPTPTATPTPIPTPRPLSPDRDKLVALYNSANGANWKDWTNWLSDRPIGEWRGVTADSNGRVTRLWLDDNNLSGQIPDELGSLTRLETLALSQNQLYGHIPSELGNLSNLTTIRLSGNRLAGCVPNALRNVQTNDFAQLALPFCDSYTPMAGGQEREALQALHDFANGANWTNNANWMSDKGIGVWYGVALDNTGAYVTGLSLPNNNLGGQIPPELGNLTRLETLDLSNNDMIGEIPVELKKLTSLKTLKLGGNPLSGCVPEGLRDISDNDIHAGLGLPDCDATPMPTPTPAVTPTPVPGQDTPTPTPTSTVAVTPTPINASQDRDVLSTLHGNANGYNWTNSANWLSEKPIGQWHGVTVNSNGRVTALSLSNNNLSGQIPPELGNLTYLQTLDLSNNDLFGDIPSELANLSNLTTLYLGGNSFGGCVPKGLRDIPNNDIHSGTGLPDCDTTPTPTLTATPALIPGQDTPTPTPTFSPTPTLVPGQDTPTPTPTFSPTPTPVPARDTPTPTPTPINASQDRDVLSTLHGNANGYNWTNSANWLSEKPIGQWHGVTVNSNGRVTALSLSNNNLSGQIPPELGNLTYLQTLDLSNNDLFGDIPSELANLSNLTTLYLGGNSFGGCVPKGLRDITNNDIHSGVGLPDCDATQSSPDRSALVELHRATNGSEWTDRTNWVSDRPVGQWRGVTANSNGRVTGIALPSNNLSGQLPSELGSLASLTTMDLSDNNIGGQIPSELGNLSGLTTLSLSGNNLTGCIPRPFQNIPGIGDLGMPICEGYEPLPPGDGFRTPTPPPNSYD